MSDLTKNQQEIEELLDLRIKRLLELDEWVKPDVDEFEKLNKILSECIKRRLGIKPKDWTDGASDDELDEVLPE